MGSQRLWSVLCVMAVCYQTGMSSRYDGLFGQCLLPQQEMVLYEVSVPVLHRLQEVLKELMMQGLSWQDDITQYVIRKELSRVSLTRPLSGRHDNPSSQSSEPVQNAHPSKMQYPPSSRTKAQGDDPNPDLMQSYLDYMIVDPPKASQSLHMKTLDPYTYRQQYGYQDDEERSLNSLEGGGFPRPSTHAGGKESRPQDRDRQVLQDLVSLYLSSPAQPASRHRGAATPISTSPLYQDLDFPLDYAEDYVSQQDVEVRKQQQLDQTQRKAQKDYGSLAGLDDDSLQKVALLLDHYGIDMKDLTPSQLANLPAALKQLQMESATDLGTDTADKYRNSAAPRKKITEGAMTHKVDKSPVLGAPTSLPAPPPGPQASPDHPPTMGAPPATEGASVKEPGAPVETKTQGKKEPPGGTTHVKEEYGYIVTNQSPLSLYDGVRLLGLLAERIPLSTGSFINIR
uniref:receptor-type tyrosine-protein phosphatase-like N isoform X2 n=1 Tax=Oncorhynchus gorbuscha TaxID=8017 RepID=UPI001EAECF41|nr:receptor-type tyrosine-protein phosphatase-like N isoform X2 [Oncorhynchus gorbuscha]